MPTAGWWFSLVCALAGLAGLGLLLGPDPRPAEAASSVRAGMPPARMTGG